MFHFHKYRPIYRIEKYIFLGEELTRNKFTGYVKCVKCNKYWEQNWCEMGSYNTALTEQESMVLERKINDGMFYLKGKE